VQFVYPIRLSKREVILDPLSICGI
jgi:hypothetical protein